MAELRKLINVRKYIRKCITEQYNRREGFSTLDSGEREKSRLQFEDWVADLKLLNNQILALKFDDWDIDEEEKKSEEEFKLCQEYNDKLFQCLASLKAVEPDSPPSRSVADEARSLLKSPVAPLPKYNSSPEEDLFRFFEEFEDTISKFRYPEYDKLLLLKQQLSGRALILVNSLEADKKGYTFAKELLLKAFASGDTQKFNVLKQLTEVRLDYSSDPYEYISNVRLLIERVNKLGITVDNILQFFIWEGMNEQFKLELIQITNHAKPSLKEITENYFEACDRFLSKRKSKLKNKFASPKGSDAGDNVASFAVKVKYDKSKGFKPCSICTKEQDRDATHPINKCPKYESPISKVDQIRKYGGCIKCSNLNHESGFCRYYFSSRCRYCSEWHMGFLCVKGSRSDERNNNAEAKSGPSTGRVKTKPVPSNVKSLTDDKPRVSSSMLTIAEAFQGYSDIDSILPTFTSTFEGGLKVRCLKDSGCQCNFISTGIADKLGLKTVRDNISLTINGINTSQQYTTRLVEAKLKFGSRFKIIEALCLPCINIHLKLPLLGKVVEGFKDRGYVLADEFLSSNDDEISGIDFILGANSSCCLPQSEHLFGAESLSMYSQTSAGVLLQGNLTQVLKDLLHLPYVGHCFNGSVKTSDSDLLKVMRVSGNACLASDQFIDDKPVPRDFCILDDKGEIVHNELEKAASCILNENYNRYLGLEDGKPEEYECEINVKLSKYALENMKRNEEGRIIVPLLWNFKVAHLLGTNHELAKMILKSNLRKLLNNPTQLAMMDQSFKEQEAAGIIERIDNLDQFLTQHPNHSFLPHIGIFRLDRETTKCRVVYLSNLCQKDPSREITVSHNQAIYPGPTLNQKIASALLHVRFGSHLLCFDICKAFNNLALNEVDSNRLLCLWFRNVEKNDFTVVGYRNVRLSFGLRCSPALLLLALYKILILEVEHDSVRLVELKKLIYQLCYMDNCAVAFDCSKDLEWAYLQLNHIFDPYKFKLQQFVTNDLSLQKSIDVKHSISTNSVVKLLGLFWNRDVDSLSTRPFNLDVHAKTKRDILRSIASQFDLYNFNGPMLNRSRLFMHSLQCNNELGWDDVLDKDLQRQWKNIAKQANASPVVSVPRFIGSRNDCYSLLAFADSSKFIFGVVIFIFNISTGSINFVMAKNRIVGKNLNSKSIPSLELQGIALAAECLVDLYEELAGHTCVNPIRIVDLQVYSDSLVALSWIHSYSIKLDKLQKVSVFIKNRLLNINETCEKHPITFSFISGEDNPADCITRCLSYKQLMRTNYFSGPEFLKNNLRSETSRKDTLVFTVPNPDISISPSLEEINSYEANLSFEETDDHYVQTLSRVSDFHKLILTYRAVLIYVNKLKLKVKSKHPDKFAGLKTYNFGHNFFADASRLVLLKDQRHRFPEVLNYFDSSKRLLKELPKIVGQLNLYIDNEGLLRVRSKLDRLKEDRRYRFPILLSKDSPLTQLIIENYHKRFAHAGCYSLLSEIRKTFWIPCYFSTVKKVLKACVTCRRFNERTIKVNQNSYRDFRVNPPEIPYRAIFVDYMGPFFVRSNKQKIKVWLLCITCTWSRAINLQLCMNMTVNEYLRAFQIHCFEYGIPELCISDMGTQLVAGANVIMDFLKDPEVKLYFEENGIKPIQFQQFFKGNSALGSMVESCVKLTKKLIYGAIRNNVLEIRDFEFLISQTIHMVNRRPIAFKEALRETDLSSTIPEPITPESLLKGYDLVSVNVIPPLQQSPDLDLDDNFSLELTDRVRDNFSKLRKVRQNLIDIYHSEFITSLLQQAVGVKDRYNPIKHSHILKNDIVLIKEPFSKASHYPMAIVRETLTNELGEVTGAVLCKGKTGEITKRHVSNLIFLLRPKIVHDEDRIETTYADSPKSNLPKREAAKNSIMRTRQILNDETGH